VASPTGQSTFSNIQLHTGVAMDVTPPVITLLGDDPQVITVGDPYVESGATAVDDVDGDLSASLVIDASGVDTSMPGDYVVTYRVSDATGNTAQADRAVQVVAAVPQTTHDVDFSELVVSPLGAADVDSVVSVEDGGASLRVVGNGWKKVDLPTVVTPDTVLEFDFASSSRGEVHGIGFDTDLNPSANWTFRVYGSQNWGLGQFASYVGPGVMHYTIPVGQYFTGTFPYLVFAMDHDVSSPSGESWFSNVRVYEAAPATSYVVDFDAVQVGSFGSQDNDTVYSVGDGGASLSVAGNGTKMLMIPTEITADSVLEFDFASSSRGEVHGIGFDTDLNPSANWTFRVYGSQNWGLGQFATYVGPGVTHYTIPVGEFFTGRFPYIVFVNDHDVASPTGQSTFSNIQLHTG
jgi:hypothetical protein